MTGHAKRTSITWLLSSVVLVVGIYCIVEVNKTQQIYRCGEAPSIQDFAHQCSYPTCLQVRSSQFDKRLPTEPLCLQVTKDDTGMPMWCNEEVSSWSHFLYFSSCQVCGPAWRIFHSPRPSESWFKFPINNNTTNVYNISAEDQTDASPDPSQLLFQSSNQWLARNDGNQTWYNNTITLESCDIPNSTIQSSVPDACFYMRSGFNDNCYGPNWKCGMGLWGLLLGGVVFLFTFCCCCNFDQW